MGNKIKQEIVRAYSNIDTAAMAVISIVLLIFKPLAGIIALVLCAALWTYHRYYTETRILKKISEYKQSVVNEREDMMDAFASGAPLLLCLVDKKGKIHWSNTSFIQSFQDEESFRTALGEKKFNELYENDKAENVFSFEKRIFKISSSFLGRSSASYRLLFISDITDAENTRTEFENSRLCLGIVEVDNYEDMMQDTSIENRSKIIAQIDEVIFGWAKKLEAGIYKLAEHRYIVLFRQQYLEEQKQNDFSVLEEIHAIKTEADFPTSISVGIGAGDSSFQGLNALASEAMDLALGRGGDQLVLRTLGGDTEYFGGTLPGIEKRRQKTRARVVTMALQKLINDAESVMIMGHARPDMDSFGASLGVYALCYNLGKKADIVLENPGDGIEAIYSAAAALKGEDGADLYSFISHAQARTMITNRTLLVMVDHHRQALSEDPGLVEVAERIVVIDHHRQMEDAVKETQLSYTDTYISSASEMVTQILISSADDGDISKFEAEALLAGITLDTKNFTINTGVGTFESAVWLRRKSADPVVVREYFKEDLDFYRKKNNIIANAEILENGFAVSYTKELDPGMQVIVSQAADELLKMKGVVASVVAGSNGNATMVSARSSRKYNVQTLMEKLGGGGHQTVAAVQLTVGPEEAIAQVVQAMRLEGIL